jgi:hypothetical protein
MWVHQDGAVSTTFIGPQFRRRHVAMPDNTEQEQRCIAVQHEWDNGADAE